jgi:hypothetical protein
VAKEEVVVDFLMEAVRLESSSDRENKSDGPDEPQYVLVQTMPVDHRDVWYGIIRNCGAST